MATTAQGFDPAPRWLGQLIEQSSDAIAAFDRTGTIVYANAAAHRLLHAGPVSVVGLDALSLVHPDDLSRAASNLAAVADGVRPFAGLLRVNRLDGEVATVDITPMQITLADPPEGPGSLTAVVLRDTTLLDAHWNFLIALSSGAAFDECLTTFAEGMSTDVDGPMGIAFDGDGCRRTAGPVPPALLGVDGGRVDGRAGTPWNDALSTRLPTTALLSDLPPDLAEQAALLGAAACVCVPVPDPGAEDPALIVQWPPHVAMVEVLRESLIRRPHLAVLLALERRHDQARLEYLAHRDALTGLANRRAFFDHLERLAATSSPFGICYVDLDGFKPLNDEHGHAAGDLALIAVAERLAHAARSADIVARLGGDEFAVLCPGITGNDECSAVAQRLVHAVAEPFAIDGRLLHLGTSVGVATSWPGAQPDDVVARADAALYEAKRAGRNTWRCAPPTA